MGFRLVIGKKIIQIKTVKILLVLLILVQIGFVLTNHQVMGKEREDNNQLTPNNPIPAIAFDDIKVENDILFACRKPLFLNEINIYNVSDHLNLQHYATYTLNSSIADNSSIVKYQIFDEKMFIVIEIINNSAANKFQTALEIVDITDVQNPIYLSHMVFNGTGHAEHPYNPDYHYRMFYKDDLLYVTVYVNSYLFIGDSIYVINCTDIYHPEEIIRTDYIWDNDQFFFDFYLIDDVLYTIVDDNSIRKISVYNYTDLANISTISTTNFLTFEPYRFIGLYNDYFFIDTYIGQCSLQIYDNYTLGFVNNWSFSDPTRTACIKGQKMFSVSSQTFCIYNLTEIGSIQQIWNYTADTSADVRFQRLAIDKTRAYISSGVAFGLTPILYIMDFSDEANPVQLLPEVTAIAAIPLFSILFALSIVSILMILKKKL